MEPQALVKGECDYCGNPVPDGKIYCSKECRVSYGNILARQGKVIMQAAKVWRRYRGRAGSAGAGMLMVMASRVDAALVEDRMRKQRLKKREAGQCK